MVWRMNGTQLDKLRDKQRVGRQGHQVQCGLIDRGCQVTRVLESRVG